tara:strand:- start:275 stop:1027 length:753 start_codon:yes stop_codon:yes gene_type:complete
MDRTYITFNSNPTIQIIGQDINPPPRNSITQNMLQMLNSLIHNDNILQATLNGEENDENINNSVSEEFMNNLDELVVDENIEKEGIECSICLDKFKIGDKYIKLPCKDHPHFFHCGESEECSGIRPWLERNNTCPLCRTEFPTGDSIVNQNPENEMIESTELEPILPQSLIPSVVNTLNPEQVSGLRDNEDNIHDTTDNNIINVEEHIINAVDNYLRQISNDIIRDELNVNADTDLQRAIELSLQDNINE